MPPAVGHFGGITVGLDPVGRDDRAFRDAGPAARRQLVGRHAVVRALEEHATGLGGVRRGTEVSGCDAGEDGVIVHVGGERVRTGWLVGCDGGRSLVRERAGFAFPGTDPGVTGHQALADLDGADRLPLGWQRTGTGVYVHGPLPGRVLTVEFDGPPTDRDAPVTERERQDSIRGCPEWTSRCGRSAVPRGSPTTRGRPRPTAVAGCCSRATPPHVHPPFGGQGLNLGWKLAATTRRTAPDRRLDTDTAERHPIGEWVLDWTRAQIAVMQPDRHSAAVRSVPTELFATGDDATYLAATPSGVLHRYPVDGEHDLIGLGAPDFAFVDLGARRPAGSQGADQAGRPRRGGS